jgi:hypothetical protein
VFDLFAEFPCKVRGKVQYLQEKSKQTSIFNSKKKAKGAIM